MCCTVVCPFALQSRELNLRVGADGVPGKPMIQRMAGLTVTVQRPLRDLFKKLPSFQFHFLVRPGVPPHVGWSPFQFHFLVCRRGFPRTWAGPPSSSTSWYAPVSPPHVGWSPFQFHFLVCCRGTPPLPVGSAQAPPGPLQEAALLPVPLPGMPRYTALRVGWSPFQLHFLVCPRCTPCTWEISLSGCRTRMGLREASPVSISVFWHR